MSNPIPPVHYWIVNAVVAVVVGSAVFLAPFSGERKARLWVAYLVAMFVVNLALLARRKLKLNRNARDRRG
jgi:uncharacterized membrane protein YhaH (DUF805 family)